ncbi:MAG: HAMP domain-containing sensor histidine kinase [Actinomycetota bacterium]
MRSRWERLGLRARVSSVFALGGLLLSIVLSLTTLAFTRQNLLDQREDTAFSSFIGHSLDVQAQLTEDSDQEAITTIIESLSTSRGAFPLVRVDDAWTASNPSRFDNDGIPTSLMSVVDANNAGAIRTTIDGVPAIISGIRLTNASRDADYYEALFLDDVEDTLSSIGVVLIAASLATTILAAGLGVWAAARALSPVGDVRRVAESLAAGELDTRLTAPADADLASLAASFNGMAQSLEDRIERDARFASEVSHELRSPLMTLSASVEVLNNSRDTMPERSQQALGLLNDDITRFTQLVEDLLEISRFDVGTASLQSQPLLIVEFVRQAVGHSARPDAVVVATPDVEELVIVADKRRLAQVIANLVENADKYGGGEIEVQISAYGDTAILAVEDEGPGVPVAERDVIFDRFSRGAAGGRRGYDTGSGLGLSLVVEHIGLHGGRVWVEDRLDGGDGARFVIALPIGEVDEEDEL